MPVPSETEFTAWEFTDEEFLEAACFSELQIKFIQTEMARYAQQQINATVESTDPFEFAKAHEYRRGLIGSLKYLLEMSKSLELRRNAMIEKRIATQQADVPNIDLSQV